MKKVTIVLCVIILAASTINGCSHSASQLEELLGLVPASVAQDNEQFALMYTDYASMFSDLGVEFDTMEELVELSGTPQTGEPFPLGVALGASFILGGSRYMENTPITKGNVGYDFSNVKAELKTFLLPPRSIVVAAGSFDPKVTKDALSNQSEWPEWAVDEYAAQDYNGVTIHSWGSGYEPHMDASLVPPNADELGRAVPLAVTDRFLFSDVTVDDIKLMVEAFQNKTDSLADLPEYISIAEALAREGINQALIGDSSIANQILHLDTSDNPVLKESIENNLGTLLKKFDAFATAAGMDDEKGNYVLVVLYHEKSELAQQNVPIFKDRMENGVSPTTGTPWNEVFTSLDIKAKGKLLIAKLYTEHTAFWNNWVYMPDNFLVHEE